MSLNHSSLSARSLRGRSQLSTFVKAHREYARGEVPRGSGTTVRFFPENQHFIFYH